MSETNLREDLKQEIPDQSEGSPTDALMGILLGDIDFEKERMTMLREKYGLALE